MPVNFLPVKPFLRAAVRIGEKGEAELRTPGGVLEAEAPEGMGQRDSLRLLDGSRTIDDLERETGLDGEAVREVLDEQGMIAEVEEAAEGGMSGVSAYAYLRRHADRVRAEVSGPLVEALVDGSVTRGQLIGYAVEYRHITHLCPRPSPRRWPVTTRACRCGRS